MENTQQAQMTPALLVKQAIATCHAFSEHLDFENKALEERDIAAIEDATKTKRHLGAKLETLLKDVRASKDDIRRDANAVADLQNLQVAIDAYQIKARKNVLMLSAAHEATAQFLNVVRQAVIKLRPKVTTYGQTGYVQESTASAQPSSLVRKDI